MSENTSCSFQAFNTSDAGDTVTSQGNQANNESYPQSQDTALSYSQSQDTILTNNVKHSATALSEYVNSNNVKKRRIGGAETGEEIAPFVLKLKSILDDPETDNIIRWKDTGTGFVILRPADLSTSILPKMFRAKNSVDAFIRQLNGYGFSYRGPTVQISKTQIFESNDHSVVYEHASFYRDAPTTVLSTVRPPVSMKGRNGTEYHCEEERSTTTRDNGGTRSIENAAREVPEHGRLPTNGPATISSVEDINKVPTKKRSPIYWPVGSEVTPNQADALFESTKSELSSLPLGVVAATTFEDNGIRRASAECHQSLHDSDASSIDQYLSGGSFPDNCCRVLMEAHLTRGNQRDSLGLNIIEVTSKQKSSKCHYFIGGIAQDSYASATRLEPLAVEFSKLKKPESICRDKDFEFQCINGKVNVILKRKQLRIQPGDRLTALAGWSLDNDGPLNPASERVLGLLAAPISTHIRLVLERWISLQGDTL